MPPCHLGERCTGSRARPNTRVQKKKKKLQKLPHIQNAQCRVQGVYEGEQTPYGRKHMVQWTGNRSNRRPTTAPPQHNHRCGRNTQ